jgi:hypothetical protein
MQLTSSRGPSSITSETVVTVGSSHTGRAEFLRRGPTVVWEVALPPPQAAISRANDRASDKPSFFDISASFSSYIWYVISHISEKNHNGIDITRK